MNPLLVICLAAVMFWTFVFWWTELRYKKDQKLKTIAGALLTLLFGALLGLFAYAVFALVIGLIGWVA